MGTTTDKLNHLIATKEAIKKAIVAKGVSVADTDTFRSYADKIASIEAGGGGSAMEYWSVPEGVELGELLLFFPLIRIMSSGSPMVASALIYGWVSEGFFNSTLLAVAYDPTMKFISEGEVLTAAEMLAGIDFTTIGLTQITEEEFYSIN